MLIAIVGNVRSEAGDVAVHAAEQAARELGRQLAIAGHGIVVYSSDRNFVEAHVVNGYVASQKAVPGSMRVRYPQGGAIAFPERETHSLLFDLQPDSSSDWEISFYDSLNEVDGILLLGGGRSTLIAGMIGLGYEVAVVPIPTFGGYPQKVWNVLQSRGLMFSKEELALMAHPAWKESDRARVVGLFKNQADRLSAREEAAKVEALRTSAALKRSAFRSVALFLAVGAMILLSVTTEDLPVYVLGTILAVGAVLAGISGATMRTLPDLNENQRPNVSQPTYIRTSLGIVAGLFSALLVAVPQLTSDVYLPEHALKALTDAEMLHMKSA